MNIRIDTEMKTIEFDRNGSIELIPLYSKAGIEALTEIWIKVQWNQLAWRSLSWHGFPLLQLSEDLLRLQEVLFRLGPDVIVETGVNQGGSAVFFASLCRLIGKGRVIAIDIEIPPNVRDAIAQSPYGDMITLIESDSVAPETVRLVRQLIGRHEKTFFFLDSDHSKSHVLRELNAYADMVSVGSYIVAADGIMERLGDTPIGSPKWLHDNPAVAARDFVRTNEDFVIEPPEALFGQEHAIKSLTYWPDAWLLRRRASANTADVEV
ncbi:CmcI family methyltransferase [Desulfatitalea alkaliphila]|uniref:Cephalosporin hydroxylase family protein n=1 Tax=Desulfatitalea alkaliphila TaxID=2929485 RepID=A0AA41QYK8_9BACT|nr:CmcI family methyltransferase [Desulfatitalea alkaliphila]MCJ8499397.1 cephalosporin hydroxylase family protein [Desulfatitalea alkaliphila]